MLPPGKLPVLLSLVLCLAAAPAQQRPKKVLTQQQVQYQAEWREWLAQYNTLIDTANAALKTEFAREKAGDCPNSSTTRDAEICLNAEVVKTQKNYTDFISALRALLALAAPTMPGEGPVSGPTGTPLTADQRIAEFDRIEQRSKDYRDLCTTAAYNLSKGGTVAPVFALETQQRMLRLHLHELAFIYGDTLSHH